MDKESILILIKELVTDLESANLDAATETSISLLEDFGQLLRRRVDPSKGTSQSITLWNQLGLDGMCVHDVSDHLRQTDRLIKDGDRLPALTEARRALERWAQC